MSHFDAHIKIRIFCGICLIINSLNDAIPFTEKKPGQRTRCASKTAHQIFRFVVSIIKCSCCITEKRNRTFPTQTNVFTTWTQRTNTAAFIVSWRGSVFMSKQTNKQYFFFFLPPIINPSVIRTDRPNSVN